MSADVGTFGVLSAQKHITTSSDGEYMKKIKNPIAEKLMGKTITIAGCTDPSTNKEFPILVTTVEPAYNFAVFIVNGRYLLSYAAAVKLAEVI